MKFSLKIIPLSLIIALTGGCAVHTSQMDRAKLGPPEQFTETAGNQLVAGDPVDYGRLFHDTRLNELLAQALANNQDLAAAAARIEQMESLARISNASLLPFVNLGGGIGLEQQVSGSGTSDGNYSTLALAAGYEVDLWDKLKNTKDAASLKHAASREDFQTLAISVAAQVAELHYLTTELREQLKLSEEIIKALEEHLTLIELRYEQGLVSTTDLYQARQSLLEAQTAQPEYKNSLAAAEHALAILIGDFPAELQPAAVSLPDIKKEQTTGLPAGLMARRPDIRAALLRLRSSDREIAAAVAGRYPSLNLGGQLGYSRIDFGNVVSDLIWSVLMEAAAPIFDGGRLAAEVDRNRAAFKEKLADYHKTVLIAFLEVEDALAAIKASRQKVDLVEGQLTAARANLQVTEENYLQGVNDYLPVASARVWKLQLESQLVREKRALISATIGLTRALGSGLPADKHENISDGTNERGITQ